MKFSLRTKTVLLMILLAAVISVVGIVIGAQALRRVVDDSYSARASGIASSMGAVLDTREAEILKNEVFSIYNAAEEKVTSDDWGSPEFDAYMALFAGIEETKEFISLRQQLRRLQDVNEVDCLYLAAIEPTTEAFIYLVDGAYEDACPPGCIDPLFEENMDILDDPTIGFPPYITDTETYGWLVTAGVPVYNEAGEVVCYSMVDISMDVIRAQQRQYVLVLVLILIAMTVAVCVVAIWAVNRAIIRPINQLSSAAAHFNAGNENSNEIEALQIKTKDEIQSLFESYQQMTRDIRGYIDNLVSTTQELTKTRMEADEMNVLAHRDALTGVGSKLAYDGMVDKLTEEMQQGGARFGIVMVDMNGLKQLNDTYGHEKGNVAIRKTCALICDVFSHSPVYRFGGDEFVVVVKTSDYDAIAEKVEQFKRQAAKTQGEPWEIVNAAIGYALYDNDDTVDDVFRKADHIMYEHKKEMKRK